MLITVIADVNSLGATTVQDIIDLLALYFAQDTRAQITLESRAIYFEG